MKKILKILIRKKKLLVGIILSFCLFIFVLRFARKEQGDSVRQEFAEKEAFVQKSTKLIEDTLMKNRILANQLEESNRNYQLLLNSATDKDSLNLIKKRILNDILSKSSFPIPPREDDDSPQPSPQPEEPIPTPNPEDRHLEYLGPAERDKILSNYQLFSNKPN